MTAHFLIDAIRPVAPFRQSMGTELYLLFRPTECVREGGTADSVRLTPTSAHEYSAFFDLRSSPCRSIPAKHGDRGGKFIQAFGVRDRRGVVRLRSADASLRSR